MLGAPYALPPGSDGARGPLGDLLTQVERRAPVVQIILNNGSLDFVNIEQQEAGIIPFGVEFKNPNFVKVAEAMGAKGIRIEEPGDVRDGLLKRLRTRAARLWSMR
jgi:pyruvate dehydrogenase (quinone)